jgi:hypothetical protein
MSNSTIKNLLCVSFLIVLIYFLYNFLSNNNKQTDDKSFKQQIGKKLDNHKTSDNNIINVPSNDLSNNVATINLDSITKNIMFSEENNVNNILLTDENLFSETTSKLIDNSYNDLLNGMYVNMFMKLSFDHMGTTKFVDFHLKLTRESVYTNNFIDLIRNYIGSSVFAYNYSNKIMFLGDCYNNNGSANYDANHSLLKINYNKPKFIPANTICYLVEKHDDSYYIGSQFVILLQDINNTTKLVNDSIKDKKNIKENEFFKKYVNQTNYNDYLLNIINLIPFCSYDISNNDTKFIEIFYNNDLNVIKPKITLINNVINDNNFNNLF